MDDVIVIGSGPAGMTAAMYTARANHSTKVITGPQIGGQVSLTWEIENYPGFPEAPSGSEVIDLFTRQMQKFGAELVYDEATAADFSGPPFTVTTYGGELRGRSVVIALGARPRRLDVPGEREFLGRGVSFCATCDGAFFKEHDVVVVGGGDSAVEEAIFLTRYASSVRVIHRRDELRASAALQKRAKSHPKIQFVWNSVVEEIVGADKVQAVRVRNRQTDGVEELATTGVFVFIGHDPNSALLRGHLDLDEQGYVKVDSRMATSIPGVFAAGEIMDPVWRQVATSVGQGCMAGMAIVQYLGEIDD